MSFKLIDPEVLGAPSGYSHGVLANGGGKLLFIGGQIAVDKDNRIVSDDLVEQFDRALANVIAVLDAAGGKPENVARMVIYVTDKNEYRNQTREIGKRYQKYMGKHFPAMVLVQVVALLEDAAKVEIEAMAVI
jgi:enamine deaminase RidA (YjgF/YER057c/UK114 family)